jgi:hypothetical protein
MPHFFVCTHEGTIRTRQADVPLADEALLRIASAEIHAMLTTAESPHGGVEMLLRYRVTRGNLANASVGIRFCAQPWSTENYVLMPAAVYNANRYPRGSRSWNPGDPGLKRHDRIAVTYVPRLHPEGEPEEPTELTQWNKRFPGGPSRIQLLTGDCSSPIVGVQMPGCGKGVLISTDQGTTLGNSSLSIFESDDRSAADIIVKAPGVREEVTCGGGKSHDRGVDLAEGDEAELRIVLHVFDASDIPAFFEKFFSTRNELRGNARHRNDIPFSATWKKLERKYNTQNWVEKEGYYSVGMRESPPQDWQTGWVGGPNAAYALLVEGDPMTYQRAIREWDFIANNAVTPSGFIKSTYHNGQWHGKSCYLRYSVDTLYFLMKTLLLVSKRAPHFEIPLRWTQLALGVCDGFVKQFEREGRFVHHVDPQTGETLVGGSCAAGLGPAGLAMAARFFDQPRYLEIAEAAGEVYVSEYVNKGITNGGPGDIFQCIDSESAAGLLDSFAVLYEETGRRKWLEASVKMAHLFSSWTMSYDYEFPASSTFGKLDMLTTGTVWANIQNKHSAPGICTLSGDSLLKIFRASGDRRILRLIREIAHAMPQYMSRADRPIIDVRPGQRWPVMPDGWMNERVNTSDWEVRGDDTTIGVGEIFGGSCWCEASMMLTYAELPGVYLQTDTLLVEVFDHIYCQINKVEPDRVIVAMTNPTRFDASVKLLAESSQDCRSPLGITALSDATRVDVPAGTTVEYVIGREDNVGALR